MVRLIETSYSQANQIREAAAGEMVWQLAFDLPSMTIPLELIPVSESAFSKALPWIVGSPY